MRRGILLESAMRLIDSERHTRAVEEMSAQLRPDIRPNEAVRAVKVELLARVSTSAELCSMVPRFAWCARSGGHLSIAPVELLSSYRFRLVTMASVSWPSSPPVRTDASMMSSSMRSGSATLSKRARIVR